METHINDQSCMDLVGEYNPPDRLISKGLSIENLKSQIDNLHDPGWS